MPVEAGKRYQTCNGTVFIAVRGGPGKITDDGQEVHLFGESSEDNSPKDGTTKYKIGSRLTILEPDGVDEEGNSKVKQVGPEILITNPGTGDLRYEGRAFEVITPKILPSAD